MVNRSDIKAKAGSVWINDGTERTGLDCEGFFVHADAVVASITYITDDGYKAHTGSAADMTVITAPAWVPGRFSAIQLTSGDIQCVNTHQV